jgi:hypothetical protein
LALLTPADPDRQLDGLFFSQTIFPAIESRRWKPESGQAEKATSELQLDCISIAARKIYCCQFSAAGQFARSKAPELPETDCKKERD